MAGKESLNENKSKLERYKGFNKKTRNIALSVAGGEAIVGAGLIIMPALYWAGGDQIQISAIDRYKGHKKERQAKKLARSGKIYP